MHRLDLAQSRRREVARAVAGRDHRARSGGRAHHDTGVAVVDAELVVVGGDQERPPGVGALEEGVAGLGGEPLLDAAVPVAYAERAVAVRAQEAVLVERAERPGHVAAVGRVTDGEGSRQGGAADTRGRVGVGDPLDGVVTRGQDVQRRVRVAGAQRLGQRVDLGAEPVGRVQRRDRRVGAALEPAHHVAQHRAGLDRGELVRVADEHQPRVGAHGLEQPRHLGQRDHRGLVDHDHVVREPVAAVVAEARGVARVGPQQPVEGRGGDAGEPCAVGVLERRRLLVHRLLQPRGGLAGRRGERDPQAVGVLVEQPHEQARHRRRLAGAGTAGQHGRPLPGRGEAGRDLLVVGGARPCLLHRGHDPRHRGAHRLGVDRGAAGGAGEQVVDDLGLLLVVAVEVEQVVVPPDQPELDERARGDRGRPLRERRPGEVVGVGDGGEVEADRPAAHRPDRERDGEQDRLVVLAGQPSERQGDVHVGAGQDPGGVEVGEKARRPEGEAGVGGVHRLEEVAHGRTPSRRSDSAVTRATGGCQEKTPHGRPSTTGVCGPHMPRR